MSAKLFKEGNLVFKEKYLEEGLNVARKRSSLFTVIMISIFVINTTAAASALMSIPNLLYEPGYLCKNESDEFKIICKKEFVCNNKNIENKDYILDKQKYKTSFITEFNIYCSDFKISLFGTAYFFGGLIGQLIAPEVLKYLGNIELVIYSSITCIFCNIILFFTNHYYIAIVSYSISMIARNILQIPNTQYQAEMVKPNERAFVIGLNSAMNYVTGILVIFMEVTTGDYKGEILTNCLLFIFSIVVAKIFLVDSVRNTFLKGNYMKVIEDLEYIAGVNGSQLEFNEWKAKVMLESKDLLDENTNIVVEDENNKNKYKLINYWSIWQLKSMIKVLFIFTFLLVLAQLNLIFLLYEQKKLKNFYLESIICYILGMCGNFAGAIMIENDYFKRKLTNLYSSLAAGVVYIITGACIITLNFREIIFVNVFLNALLTSVSNTWAFENLPSLVRNHFLSVMRIISRIVNLGTPFLMVYFSVYLYLTIGAIEIVLYVLMLHFDIKETKGQVLEEFPEEMRNLKKME